MAVHRRPQHRQPDHPAVAELEVCAPHALQQLYAPDSATRRRPSPLADLVRCRLSNPVGDLIDWRIVRARPHRCVARQPAFGPSGSRPKRSSHQGDCQATPHGRDHRGIGEGMGGTWTTRRRGRNMHFSKNTVRPRLWAPQPDGPRSPRPSRCASRKGGHNEDLVVAAVSAT